MTRATTLLTTAALALSVSTVAAAPPPPPPEGFPSDYVRQSCDGAKKAKAASVPISVQPVDPASVGLQNGMFGRLAWKWGFRLSGSDARLGRIVGLDLDGEYGLVAVTAAGDWLTFDIQHGTLGGLKTVGIAPIAGAPGAPSSLANIYGRMLVSFPKPGVVADFELSKCGFAARPATVFTAMGEPKVTMVVDGAYTYVGLVGQDADGLKSQLALPYRPQEVRLSRSDFPDLPGYRLQALSNSAKIVPYLVAAWRPTSGRPETRFQEVRVTNWDDVHTANEPPHATDLGRFPRPISAITSFYDRQTGTSLILASAELRDAGAVELYAFTLREGDAP